MKKCVLILGSTSPIGRAAANSFAKRGYPVFLAGRDTKELERISSDIAIRYGVNSQFGHFDADHYDEHQTFLSQVMQRMNGISGAVVAFGDMGEQSFSIRDFSLANKVISRNYTGACSILTHVANALELQKSGFIIGISSVAGDRGRQSNYVYGSAKGGFSLFLQGLRNRLSSSGVHVMTVKPGFVDTSMTFGLPSVFLVANPNHVGEKIVEGLKKNKEVMYVPWFWRIIMGIIMMIPEKIFKKMKL